MSALAADAPVKTATVQHPLAQRWGLWVAFAALAVVILLPPADGLPIAGQYKLGLLLFAVIVWMTEAVDNAVSAVIIAALMALLLGLAPNVAKPGEALGTTGALTIALGGFANTANALVVAALFIAAAMTVTGLDRRIALWVLAKVGTSTRRVVIGGILVGIVLAFFVPGATARIAFVAPIILGIILAFGADRNSRFAGLMMITAVQTVSIWNVGIKTAAAQNMVAIGFIEKVLKGGITWLDWFIAAAPFSVLISIALYFVMTRMMPPETQAVTGLEAGAIAHPLGHGTVVRHRHQPRHGAAADQGGELARRLDRRSSWSSGDAGARDPGGDVAIPYLGE